MNFRSSLFLLVFVLPMLVFAQNPIVQTNYTADPAPMVHNGTVYLYTTHDEDQTVNNFFTMNNWLCYSSNDMVNWTDHGVVLSYTDFKWARGDAWAGQCIHRNGKYYFYVPMNQKNGGNAIGVAVSDSPTGPFKDALDVPLLVGNGYIDPTVFIDDDGQAYLYWGNPDLYYVKLNDDMLSYDKTVGVVKVPLTVESFGPRKNTEERKTSYEEGPWFFKKDNLYYMLYPAGGIPEHLAYSTSTGPTGPWKYADTIMHVFSGSAFTNHPGYVSFNGKSYLFYHSAALPGGGGYKRSVCVEEFEFNSDGSIPVVTPTKAGVVNAVAYLNPYAWNQAETIAWEEGIETTNTNNGICVSDIDNNDYIKVRSVDFGNDGASVIIATVACGTRAGISKGGTIEVRLDKSNGTLIGSIPVSYTGGADEWMEVAANISGATGIHDVFFVFKGESSGNLFLFDKWKFLKKTNSNELVAINASVNTYKIDVVDGKNIANLQVVALYANGSKKDITSEAGLIMDIDKIVEISGNSIKGIGYGQVSVNVSFNGFTDNIKMEVKSLESELSVKELNASKVSFELLPGATAPVEFTALFDDGHTELVTSKVTISNPSAKIAALSNGTITAKAKGTATIKASYKGALGESKTVSIVVNVVNRSPYVRNEAEDHNEQSGIQIEDCSDTDGGKNIGFVENGDWIKINALDFENGAINFAARAASGNSGGKIEIRTDSRNGKLVGTCSINGTGGWQSWLTKTCEITDLSGVNDIYLVFTGSSGYLFNLNWWMFKAKPLSTDINQEHSISIETYNNDKYLSGLKPSDFVAIYTITGQKLTAVKANTESLKLEVVKGFVIIEVIRSHKKYVFKTVL